MTSLNFGEHLNTKLLIYCWWECKMVQALFWRAQGFSRDFFFFFSEKINKCAWSVAKQCSTLCWPHGLEPDRLLCPWDFLGKNTEVVAISFSRRSRKGIPTQDWTCVSCTEGGFFITGPPGKPQLDLMSQDIWF